MRDLTIGKNEAGQRMDKYLKKYFPEAGSGFLYKMLRKKNILLNEKKADGKEMLKQGDRIRLYLAEETIEKFRGGQMKPAVSGRKTSDIKLDVIYEDDHVAIVNKPAGMLSQKAKPSDLSLVEYFQRYLLETGAISEQELETFHPAPCNRLDRNTSGLVLCGKSLAGLQALSEALKLRTLKKYYLALVLGKADRPGHQKAWLSKDTKTNQVKVSTGQVPESSPIETAWEPVWSNGEETLLKVELITGKSHQIRCHLASLGYPLAGDPKYGNARWNRRLKQEYGLKRQFLHSHECPVRWKLCRENVLPHRFRMNWNGLQRVRERRVNYDRRENRRRRNEREEETEKESEKGAYGRRNHDRVCSGNGLGDEKLCTDQCSYSFGIDGRYDYDGRPDLWKQAVI